jgi:hypothetical protein
LPGDLGDWQYSSHGEQKGFHQQGESPMRFRPWHLDGCNRTRRGVDAWNPRVDRGAVFEKLQVFPTALDGVVNGTELAGFRIGKAGSPFEINNQFQGLCEGIEVAGNDIPW